MLVGDVRLASRGVGAFLVVVGRQPGVGFGDERLRNIATFSGAVLRRSDRSRSLSRRSRGPTGRLSQYATAGAITQSTRNGTVEGSASRCDDRHDQRDDDGDDRAGCHVGRRIEAAPGRRRCRPLVQRGRGRFPFQEPPLRNRQTDQRQHDGVRGGPGVIRKKRHAQRDLGERDRRVGPEVAPEHRKGLRRSAARRPSWRPAGEAATPSPQAPPSVQIQ